MNVGLLQRMHAAGWSIHSILESYDHLTDEQVRAALDFVMPDRIGCVLCPSTDVAIWTSLKHDLDVTIRSTDVLLALERVRWDGKEHIVLLSPVGLVYEELDYMGDYVEIA